MNKILTYGKIRDITGVEIDVLKPAKDTDDLKNVLLSRFPELSGFKFIIAVNKKIIQNTVELKEGDEIVLMPPFSGG